jgi:hypothetical protein
MGRRNDGDLRWADDWRARRGSRSRRRWDVQAPFDPPTSIALVGIPDLQFDAAAGRTEPVPGDRDLRALPHHVPPDTDPGPPFKVEPHPGRFDERPLEGRCQVRWLDDHQPCTSLPGARCQTPQEQFPVNRHLLGQIDHQHLDRATPDQGPREPKPLSHVRHPQDQEPGQIHAARYGLDRVKDMGRIQPGDHRTVRLGLRDEPERKRGLAARRIAAERHLRRADQPAGAKDRIKRRKTGGDNPVLRRRQRIRRLGKRERCQGTLGRKRPGMAGRRVPL